MDFVHRIDTLLRRFPIPDERILIDVYGWKWTFPVYNVFSDLTECIVLFGGKYIQADEVTVLVPECAFIRA
jgi:hypothetical protein